jgi:hypothetical protein
MKGLGYFQGFDLVVVLEVDALEEGAVHVAQERPPPEARLEMILENPVFPVPELNEHPPFLWHRRTVRSGMC